MNHHNDGLTRNLNSNFEDESEVIPENSRSVVIFYCKKCNYTGFNLGTMCSHLFSHPFERKLCGIFDCQFSPRSYRNLRDHLQQDHCELYSIGNYRDIEINSMAYFSLTEIQSQPMDIEAFVAGPDISQEAVSHAFFASSQISLPSPPDSRPSSDEIYPENQSAVEDCVTRFISILSSNGSNIPFKSVKLIADNLIDFFYDIQESGLPKEELFASLKNSTSSQDSFDHQIQTKFGGVFPESISIASSGDSFVVIPMKESLKVKLSFFNSINQLILKPSVSPRITSFFDSEFDILPNTVYLNIFIDDFQLANPLLANVIHLQ